jgi:hypothetical protein
MTANVSLNVVFDILLFSVFQSIQGCCEFDDKITPMKFDCGASVTINQIMNGLETMMQ